MLYYKLTVDFNRRPGRHDYKFPSSVAGIFDLCKFCLNLGRYGYTYDNIGLELIDE